MLCWPPADCCHSGTLLDHATVPISGPKSDDPEQPPQLVDTFTASAGDPDNRDIGNRWGGTWAAWYSCLAAGRFE
jgi:hypothetical protein